MNNQSKEAFKEKYTQKYHADERESDVTKEGLAAAGGIAIVYCVARIIYLGLAKSKLAVAELVLLFLMGILDREDIRWIKGLVYKK